MATQPLFQSYNPPVPSSVKPNIRVVFSAGDAVVAMRGALAELPSAVRTATLDEIAIRESTDALINDAKSVLSAPMYRAFLRWGAAAAGFESDRDEELSDGLCAALMEALGELSAVPAHSFQDALFKSWLLALEVSDSPSFGPLRFRPQDAGYILNSVAEGVGRDLPVMSPLVADIERLSAQAAALSPPEPRFPFTLEVGAMITRAFIAAAQRPNIGADRGTSWDAAMSAYLAADHLCNVMLPDDPQADAKVDACCEAMDYLIEKVRTPDLAALSLKLDLALGRAQCFEDVLFDDHTRGIIADIQHLAGGPCYRDPHASWLADRNHALLRVNRAPDGGLSEELATEQCSIATEMEEAIASTRATSITGVIAKLALIVQTALEGSSPDPDWCASALIDARRVAGIGSLDAAADARHREMAA
jgi:hypothetical protein